MHIFPHRRCFSLLAFTGESSLAPHTWQRHCVCAYASTYLAAFSHVVQEVSLRGIDDDDMRRKLGQIPNVLGGG
jgi:hypothetical protein